jgi:hypothetical protein
VKFLEDPLLSDKYLAFYSILKSLCHKQRMIETYNFVKLKINFNKGNIFKGSIINAPTINGGSFNPVVDKKGK